ncbi:MAG: hypothetical protein Q8N81_03945 [bacterium]|nr:hypothetical protein [bacterium]
MRSVICGLILGAFLGIWCYWVIGWFLTCGPLEANTLFVDKEIYFAFWVRALRYGLPVGLVIGLLGGLGVPPTNPRGHLAKSIGSMCWLINTPLAWATNWQYLQFMSAGRIAIALLVTSASMMVIIPMSHYLGQIIEPLRERG